MNPLIYWFQRLIDSFMHCWWFIGSLNLQTADFIDSFVPCFNASSIHWFIEALIHWIIQSAFHWFTGSLLPWFMKSLTIGSLIHCFVASLFHSVIENEIIHWFNHLWVQRLITSWLHSFSCAVFLSCHVMSPSHLRFFDAPHNFMTSLLLHREDFPIGPWFPITMPFFSKLPSQRVPGTTCWHVRVQDESGEFKPY